ncbi:hypothetical protein N0V83_001258 [Neocucurbitaria cava]|uniref:C2H2-type domain-containing protein n=1 Tax=Neocucurbitaria cava TaxID=798079 RepID=A0A9W8YI09_9PLEO|nr:hypothetical protein N0V83_001258 [Neocucurbitaria cava]
MDLKSYTMALMDLLPTMDHVATTIIIPAQLQQSATTPKISFEEVVRFLAAKEGTLVRSYERVLALKVSRIWKDKVRKSRARKAYESAAVHTSHSMFPEQRALAFEKEEIWESQTRKAGDSASVHTSLNMKIHEQRLALALKWSRKWKEKVWGKPPVILGSSLAVPDLNQPESLPDEEARLRDPHRKSSAIQRSVLDTEAGLSTEEQGSELSKDDASHSSPNAAVEPYPMALNRKRSHSAGKTHGATKGEDRDYERKRYRRFLSFFPVNYPFLPVPTFSQYRENYSSHEIEELPTVRDHTIDQLNTPTGEPANIKKRGRPTKAESQQRALEAAARFEVWPPPRRGRESLTAGSEGSLSESDEYMPTFSQVNPDGDEFIPHEIDEAGEKKITSTGHPLNGREYRCRTFFIPNRGDNLFMLATECARVLGYRDSYLLFYKNRTLYKIIASQAQKDDLIHQGILPYSYRSRQIAIVTARSVFRQFGSRIINNGRRVRDDYWESKARKEGFTEEDAAGEKRPGAAKAREAAAAEANHTMAFAHPYAHTGHNQDYLGATINPSMVALDVTKPQQPYDGPSTTTADRPLDIPTQAPRPIITSSNEALAQAAQSAEYNKQMEQQRKARQEYLDTYWSRPPSPPIFERSASYPTMQGPITARHPYVDHGTGAMPSGVSQTSQQGIIPPVPRLSQFFPLPQGPLPTNNSAQSLYPYIRPPAPVFSNVQNPNGQLALVGGHPGMMPGFNSGHAAQMPHFLGDPQHQQQTANDRPFKCDQCPQSFNRDHYLKRHKRIHLAVKPFPCNHCDKSFSRKDALKRHILVKGCGKAIASNDDDAKGESESPESEAVDSKPVIRHMFSAQNSMGIPPSTGPELRLADRPGILTTPYSSLPGPIPPVAQLLQPGQAPPLAGSAVPPHSESEIPSQGSQNST